MKWYIAKLVFSITSGGTSHKPQFDEQLRLIGAHCEEEALLKARQLGLKEEEIFLNTDARKVKWEFINVADLVLVQKWEDGVELYSCIHETEEAKSYIHDVHQKAIFLRKNISTLIPKQ